VDILKPVPREAMRLENQIGRHLTESDFDAAQVGDLATRLHHVLYQLWECYRRKRSQPVPHRGYATDIGTANVTEAQLSILTTLIDKGPVRMSDLSASQRVEELGWATLALAGRVTGIGDDKRVNTFQVHGPRLGAHWPRGDRAAYPGRALDGRDDGAGPCLWEMVKIPSLPQRVRLQL
jgi:hypothetical protein